MADIIRRQKGTKDLDAHAAGNDGTADLTRSEAIYVLLHRALSALTSSLRLDGPTQADASIARYRDALQWLDAAHAEAHKPPKES